MMRTSPSFAVELVYFPVYRLSHMRQQCLIDLYVHSSTGTVEEIADVASNEGLDAVCYVVDSIDDLPGAEEIDSVNERGRAVVLPGLSVEGMGSRWLILVPEWNEAPMEIFETVNDAQLLASAVKELGGTLIPICPHQGLAQDTIRQLDRFPEKHRVGWVSMVVKGSELGRHLDLEEASVSGCRILGATGPFGRVDDMGRFATLLPAQSASLASVTAALNEGLGVCVELRPAPEPKKPKKRGRRRRRPRRKRSKGSEESSR